MKGYLCFCVCDQSRCGKFEPPVMSIKAFVFHSSEISAVIRKILVAILDVVVWSGKSEFEIIDNHVHNGRKMYNFVVSILSADGMVLRHLRAQWWPRVGPLYIQYQHLSGL